MGKKRFEEGRKKIVNSLFEEVRVNKEERGEFINFLDEEINFHEFIKLFIENMRKKFANDYYKLEDLRTLERITVEERMYNEFSDFYSNYFNDNDIEDNGINETVLGFGVLALGELYIMRVIRKRKEEYEG